jgi:nucleoside-diphosphate-sugar epimerase
VGAHVVDALLARGYTVNACVTDLARPDKTEHLSALGGASERLQLHQANLLEPGSYDEAFAACSAVLHVGTAMAYGNQNSSREVYDGALSGTRNVLDSVKKARSVKRFVYTSSFAAIGHPAPSGYVYTEDDWASDGREKDPSWGVGQVDENGEMAYALAKVETEHLVNQIAEADGRFDAISVCPLIVLGPLLSPSHELIGSWQWYLGRMLRNRPCRKAWQALWNVVDVRDVGAAQALILESEVCKNGGRYQLCATDASGELTVFQLQEHLQRLFPDIEVGGAPPEMDAYLEKHGKIYESPRAHCDRARADLGLETTPIEDTLRTTGETLISLGLIEPALRSQGEANA